MLLPKRVKHRKQHRGRMQGNARGPTTVQFGEYGLKALDRAWITSRQIEAARIAMTRFIKRGGKIWIRIFPDKPITKKAAETRMGKGKGAPEEWVAVVRPGRVLYEIEGVDEATAEGAMEARGARKKKVGTVVSDKMDKTVVVRVERLVPHDVYKKYVRRRVTFKAHDEKNEFRVGDRVEIVETRPISKDKRWRVARLIERHAAQ